MAFSWRWNAHGWVKNNSRDKHSWIPILATGGEKEMQNWELHSICFYLKEYKWKKLSYTAASIFTAAAF